MLAAQRLIALEALVIAQADRISRLEQRVEELSSAAAAVATAADAVYAQHHARVDGMEDRLRLNEVYVEHNANSIVVLTDRMDALDYMD